MSDGKIIPFRRMRTDAQRRAEANIETGLKAELRAAAEEIDRRLKTADGDSRFILVVFTDEPLPLRENPGRVSITNASDELAEAMLRRILEDR